MAEQIHIGGFQSSMDLAQRAGKRPHTRQPIRDDRYGARGADVAGNFRSAGPVVVSRIPGASHCAREGEIIREMVRQQIGIPVNELEIPPVCDAMLPALGSRLQALFETARARRTR